MIKSVNDISELLKQGFSYWSSLGNVSVKEFDGLSLFNYTAKAQYGNQWNFFEIVSRGLIINKTGEIVARPFDKFFNWGEGERYTNSSIKTITEKMDGSLGILYRYNDEYRIATRGSFDSDQAQWATKFLQNNYDLSGLSEDMTLLFEIIYPENKIVIDYDGRQDLVLLGIRNRFTGKYYNFNKVEDVASFFGFNLPKVYNFSSTDQIMDLLKIIDVNSEGFVVEFNDGNRFKFKGDEYKKVHRLISGLSFNSVLNRTINNTIDEYKALIPDEFLSEFNQYESDIKSVVEDTTNLVNDLFINAPKNTRKEFAKWVMTNHKKYSSLLFAMYDGKPLEQLIYKLMF